jgi:hypothetical protein
VLKTAIEAAKLAYGIRLTLFLSVSMPVEKVRSVLPADLAAPRLRHGRWSRVSVSNTAAALRAFLRYVAMLGGCVARLADPKWMVSHSPMVTT